MSRDDRLRPLGAVIIRPPGFRGAAFTAAAAGDMRRDRSAVSEELGIPSEWATLRQVHGAEVVRAARPGHSGEGDALVTVRRGVPLAVLTADCAGVVLETDGAVAVVHAGWRGAAAGAVAEAARYLQLELEGKVLRAALGPAIGPCCFEVGPEVAELFPGHRSRTSWNTVSVDLGAALRAQAPGASWWSAGACTRCGPGWFSHRGNGAAARLAAIGWMP